MLKDEKARKEGDLKTVEIKLNLETPKYKHYTKVHHKIG